MAATLKTILTMDDSDLKAKLSAIEKYTKETYGKWASSASRLSRATEIVAQRQVNLASAVAKLRAERKKGVDVDKAELKRLKEKVTQEALALKKSKLLTSAIKTRTMAQKDEIALTKYATATIKENSKAQSVNNATKEKSATATTSLANSTIRYLRWAGTIAGVLYAADRAWRVTLGTGIQVNKMMEDNTSGIAALLSANTQMVLSNGKVVDSYEKFTIGQRVASKTIEELRKASVKTYATFPQLVQLFQQSIGHTLGMGDAFGKTTDDIIANTIRLTQRISNIAGSIGMEMTKAQEEIRSLLSGNVSTDSLIAVLLFGSPTKANEAIREAKKRGENGVKDMLDGMLKSFDVLADVDSYTRSVLTLTDAWQNFWKTASKPLAVTLTEVFKDMGGLLDKATAVMERRTAAEEKRGEFSLIKEIEHASKIYGELDKKMSVAIGGKGGFGRAGFQKISEEAFTAEQNLNSLIEKYVKLYGEREKDADLLTKIQVDYQYVTDRIKENNKALEETVKLENVILKNNEQILALGKRYTASATEEERKASLEAIDGLLENIKIKEVKLAEIREKESKKLQDEKDKAHKKNIDNMAKELVAKQKLSKIGFGKDAGVDFAGFGKIMAEYDSAHARWMKGLREFHEVDPWFDEVEPIWQGNFEKTITDATVNALTSGEVLQALQSVGGTLSATMVQTGVSSMLKDTTSTSFLSGAVGGLESLGLSSGAATAGVGLAISVGMSAIASSLGDGQDDERALQRQIDAYEEETTRVVKELESQSALLKAMGLEGTAFSVDLETISETFDGEIKKIFKTFEHQAADWSSKEHTRGFEAFNHFVKEFAGGDWTVAVSNMQEFNEGIDEATGERWDKYNGLKDDELALLQDMIIPLTNEYATSLLEMASVIDTTSTSLKTLYDETTGTTKYGDIDLDLATGVVEDYMKSEGYTSFTDMLDGVISNLDVASTTLMEVEQDLISGTTAEKNAAADIIAKALGTTILTTEEALNIIDSIDIYGNAIIESGNAASEAANEIAEAAKRMTEYSNSQYGQLLGWNSLMEQYNDQQATSIEDVAESTNSLADAAKNYSDVLKDQIAALESVATSVQSVVDTLRGGTDSSWGMSEYYKSMAETQRLSGDLASDEFADSLKDTLKYSAALMNESNFMTSSGGVNYYDMMFQQALAANKLEDLGVEALTELDVLKLILVEQEKIASEVSGTSASPSGITAQLSLWTTTIAGVDNSIISLDGEIQALHSKDWDVALGQSTEEAFVDMFDEIFSVEELTKASFATWLDSAESKLDIDMNGIAEAVKGVNELGEKFVDLDIDGDKIMDVRLTYDQAQNLIGIETNTKTTSDFNGTLLGAAIGSAVEVAIAAVMAESTTGVIREPITTALTDTTGVRPTGGFADGGVSTAPQMALVSEGRYRNEAHVPLPDGRTIPVSMGGSMQELVSEFRALRNENKELTNRLIRIQQSNITETKKQTQILKQG